MINYLSLIIVVWKIVIATRLMSTSFQQNTLFTTNDGWEIQQGSLSTFTICDNKPLFGGYQGFTSQTAILKHFTLPPHYILTISVEIVVIDMTNAENVYLNVDQYQQSTLVPMSAQNKCGSMQTESIHHLNFLAFHYFPTTIVSIFTTISSGYWGIRDFKLEIEECPIGCQFCYYFSERLECSQWKLFYQAWNSLVINDFNQQGWSQDNVIGNSMCAGIPIIGGDQKMALDGKLFKTFKLPNHSQIAIFFHYFYIDNWTIENANFIMDSNYYQVGVDSIQKINICGNTNVDFIRYGSQIFNHDGETLDLFFSNELTTFLDAFLGIRDFTLFIYKSIDLCGDGYIDDGEICDDGNINPFDGCFNCQISCVEGCFDCINGLCMNCLQGFIYNEFDNTCDYYYENTSQNQQGPIQIIEQIIVQYNQQQDTNCLTYYQQNYCIACKKGFQLENNFICTSVCGDGIVVDMEECDSYELNCNNCKLQCQMECLQCKFGKCSDCQDGWELDDNQYCQPKCGDLQIVNNEQCDDGNNTKFDGCYKCRNECQNSCVQCNLGKCWGCEQGWILNNGKCESLCGDGMTALGIEECDDGNNQKNDGCYNCKIECSDLNCETCFQGNCFSCHQPFLLYNDNCQIICGDGYVSLGYEECDDGNDIPNDGCYQCKYQCSNTCEQCNQGICQDKCEYGYYLFNNDYCDSMCGDGILTDNEICEDGNNIQYDGCFNCQYSCPLYCKTCNEGICLECQDGFKFYDQKCLPQCGDGKVSSPYEECDDSNLFDLDGCDKNCKIEFDWICVNFQDDLSQCSYTYYPFMILVLQKQVYDTYYIQLTFSQKIQTNEINYTQYIQTQLLNVSNEFYYIDFKELTPINTTLQNSEYLFKIKFTNQYDFDSIFELKLLKQVQNLYGMELLQQQTYMKIRKPKVLSEIQREYSDKFQNYNLIILLAACLLCFIYLVTGKIHLFFDMIDILQQQSFFKYINIEIPENLKIFYESSEIVTIQNLLHYVFDFEQLNSRFFSIPKIDSKYKFKEYELNADILINLQGILLIFIFLPVMLLITRSLIKLLMRIKIAQNQKTKLKIQGFLFSKSIQLNKNIQSQGFEVITYTNSFDLIFFSFLQLNALFNYFRGTVSIIIIIFTIYVTLKHQNNRIMVQLKKLSFLSILVFFQNNQIMQSVLLSLFETINVFYLYMKYKKSLFKFIMNHYPEISNLLLLILNYCYWVELQEMIPYQIQIIISWVQIGLLSSSLISVTFFEVLKFVLQLFNKLKQIQKANKPKLASLPFQVCKI